MRCLLATLRKPDSLASSVLSQSLFDIIQQINPLVTYNIRRPTPGKSAITPAALNCSVGDKKNQKMGEVMSEVYIGVHYYYIAVAISIPA